jgi:hypothetical protein
MSNWREDILIDRAERAKTINFCLSTSMEKNEVFEYGLNAKYESGESIKKGLENYLDTLKSSAKDSIMKSHTSTKDITQLRSEISSITDIISKIDVDKEYRMPNHILEKIK